MFRKLLGWFIMWGLSFLVQYLGWCEQGKAFVIISCIGWGLFALVGIIIAIAGSVAGNGALEKFAVFGVGTLVIFLSVFGTAILLASSWVATQLFPVVTYTVAFQLMSFGRCFASNNSKKNDSDDD